MPYGISWLCNENKQEIIYTDKIIPLPLQDNSGIALIKSPFSKEDSQAYIINPHGDICFDIGESIRKNERDAIMSDVYYIFNDLFFFFNVNGCDYRIQVEPKVGIVGEVILSY
ncbi:hypothetical protein [Pectobacterium sp. B1J-3]|uniref:hypothetical protein n=1 Tax=Pectobacterium sp. B1J-3 TaxID=3385371 RepID=UPI0039064914